MVVEHAQLEQSLEGELVLVGDEGEESGEGNAVLVYVVGQNPELASVMLDNCQYFGLFAYYLISSRNHGHLSDVPPRSRQIQGQLPLKLLNHPREVLETLLLQTSQQPQRLVGHVRLQLARQRISGLEDRLAGASVVGDGARGKRGEGRGHWPLHRLQDGLPQERWVVLEVVYFVISFAFLLEGIGSGDIPGSLFLYLRCLAWLFILAVPPSFILIKSIIIYPCRISVPKYERSLMFPRPMKRDHSLLLVLSCTATAGLHPDRRRLFLPHVLEQVPVLVFNVGQLVSHFTLQQQVTQVTLLQEPAVELAEGSFRTGHPVGVFLAG